MNFQRGRRQEEPEINLIPLIDIMLVLIIFLVLTTTFSKVSGLQISLPTGEAQPAETIPDEIDLAVSATGDILVNRQPVGGKDIEAIAVALGRAVPAGKDEPVVVINADAKAAHQSVINAMQAAQRAGLSRITFAVQAPPQ
ncbi:biopolymer transport protein ExbD/TolR [Aromatoleum aromaticum EbN1]|uniref:Biopolymer transport protein ExbD/TolR n=1 Tax=Aromatoleum aromaticum (strain DSM 19018 / LMG 30748 / EbN1) TaxID=76114 RepID=Q5P109_AROAE|nr:biopolymer transporter ExbD [Aromatoleum aromaticum]CAI09005.1 biopolymer transport protein ExbD/TolR [Aromatoleum aromaticum EbN1]